MIKQHKIPTIIGLLTLVVGLAAGVFLVQRNQIFFLRAAPEATPAQVKITNITSSSFSVSWLTQKETNGSVQFDESQALEQTALDDRNQITGQQDAFITHHVTLSNLKPKTRYLFKIKSDERLFDNAGVPYEITTAPVTSGSPPPSEVASGTVFQTSGDPAQGAIVYLSMANVAPQSTMVRSGGTWLIPLNTAFSTDLSGFARYDKEAQVEEIFVQGTNEKTATVITTTKNDNPVPEIILGKNYDFRQGVPTESVTPTPATSPTPESPTPTPSSKFSLEGIAPSPGAQTKALTITNPGKQDEQINTPKPEFRGTGPTGKTIQILVESPTWTGTAMVDGNGNWNWTPPNNLPAGEHKITITYLGQTISRTFTVLAAGGSELPSFTATPSATITPSPTKIPTPSPKLTPTPTATATPKLTPTPTSTASARTGMPSTEAGVPTSGNLTPSFLMFIMGLGLVFTGFILKRFLAHER